MFQLIQLKAVCLQLILLLSLVAQSSLESPAPEYQRLPPLREQASIQDAWRNQRVSNIPHILQKYGVDAWLVCLLLSPEDPGLTAIQMSQKEYAEDTVFWSLKRAIQFSARRRTTQLFLANATDPIKPFYTWIDNTPEVWSDLLDVLESQDPKTIAVNVDSEVAFSSGMHAGELGKVMEKLGKKWSGRLVSEPMIAVEYIGTMIRDRLPWYRQLQETAWALISEGFSERVITPGETTTKVCGSFRILEWDANWDRMLSGGCAVKSRS